jgi:hypothetical protein
MDIAEIWIIHEQSQFPVGLGGKDINGVCVTSVDTYASGCISSYIKHDDKLIDIEKYQILQKCKKEIEIILPALESESYIYFSRLYEMCKIIIQEAKIA